MKTFSIATVLALQAASLCCTQAVAQKEIPQAYTLHPWQASMPKVSAEAYFTNLPTDGKIETPFVLKFGLAGGWGLAPIKKPLGGKSGHHHLLINTELPVDILKPIPFSDKYVHFGKGQMEAVVNLEPGTHTLRLLLANDAHQLHFVYSKPATITVTKKNSIDPASLIKKGISLLNIKPGDKLVTPFRVQFHASGLNVAHLQQKEADTGHFRLLVVPNGGGKPAEMIFPNGQTEAWLAPPSGSYTLKLDLLDNTKAGQSLAESASVAVEVK
jgi:Domain of unknown function (DUF4399)